MATTHQGLADFLVRLGDDPELFVEYMNNRESVMEREGVTPADRDAIRSGDPRQIRGRLRTEHSGPDEAMVVMEQPGEDEPPTVMEPDEEPPVVMEPEEPPTVMEPDEAPVVMDPDTVTDPDTEQKPQAE
jgi:hypothetical protein